LIEIAARRFPFGAIMRLMRRVCNPASARQKPYFAVSRSAGTIGSDAMTAAMTIRAVIAATGALALSGCAYLDAGLVGESDFASTSAASYMDAARRSNGLPAATPDSQLDRAALEQARYMAAAGEMTHTTRRGRDFASRKKDNEIKGTAAENVAYGATDIGRVMQMWMESPPHRRNMLDPRFSHFGVASATDAKGKRYWAMVLGE
jgi:uncharacterized protein YkwD